MSKVDPLTPITLHYYVSTACQHALHAQCRKGCKFCKSTCLCNCHDPMVQAQIAALLAEPSGE